MIKNGTCLNIGMMYGQWDTKLKCSFSAQYFLMDRNLSNINPTFSFQVFLRPLSC